MAEIDGDGTTQELECTELELQQVKMMDLFVAPILKKQLIRDKSEINQLRQDVLYYSEEYKKVLLQAQCIVGENASLRWTNEMLQDGNRQLLALVREREFDRVSLNTQDMQREIDKLRFAYQLCRDENVRLSKRLREWEETQQEQNKKNTL